MSVPSQPGPTGTAPLAPLAVVTGASSGIGRSLARQFAEHGFDVLLVAEDAAVHPAAAGLQTTGVQAVPHQADLATAEGVESTAEAVRATGRPVAALALNAGVGVGGAFTETDLADHLRLVDLNCRSTVHLAGLLLPGMVARGEGRVLVTASIAAVAPGPFHATYAASKAFVHSFAEGIRHELKDTGVTVTSLMPGPTDTGFFDRADMTDTKVAAAADDEPDDVARDGYEALMAGKDHVVAGSARNKVQAAGAGAMPDAAAAAGMARMTRPGSAS